MPEIVAPPGPGMPKSDGAADAMPARTDAATACRGSVTASSSSAAAAPTTRSRSAGPTAVSRAMKRALTSSTPTLLLAPSVAAAAAWSHIPASSATRIAATHATACDAQRYARSAVALRSTRPMAAGTRGSSRTADARHEARVSGSDRRRQVIKAETASVATPSTASEPLSNSPSAAAPTQRAAVAVPLRSNGMATDTMATTMRSPLSDPRPHRSLIVNGTPSTKALRTMTSVDFAAGSAS
mmetsp:Transcript_5967/g.18838  ORF Transcript_5967/g.18838 Transcript_5967/m.18838 type:complete len:241 (-) Transcript_5967:1048-1770(-)